jgi:guanylate kinase
MATQATEKLKPRLIVISAPSGAGKTTLCERLIQEFGNQITLSISTTTRPRRPNEQEGVHYFFVDRATFQRKVDHGDFAEWAEVHQNLYGTARATIDRCLKAGKNVLFDIDVQGAINLRAQYGARTLLIFIHPPSLEVLQERLTKRSSDPLPSIERRLRNAYNELEWSGKFDHQITNDDLERAYRELKEIVKRECL